MHESEKTGETKPWPQLLSSNAQHLQMGSVLHKPQLQPHALTLFSDTFSVYFPMQNSNTAAVSELYLNYLFLFIILSFLCLLLYLYIEQLYLNRSPKSSTWELHITVSLHKASEIPETKTCVHIWALRG